MEEDQQRSCDVTSRFHRYDAKVHGSPAGNMVTSMKQYGFVPNTHASTTGSLCKYRTRHQQQHQQQQPSTATPARAVPNVYATVNKTRLLDRRFSDGATLPQTTARSGCHNIDNVHASTRAQPPRVPARADDTRIGATSYGSCRDVQQLCARTQQQQQTHTSAHHNVHSYENVSTPPGQFKANTA